MWLKIEGDYPALTALRSQYGALAESVSTVLLKVSVATLTRLLKAFWVSQPKDLSGAKSGSLRKTRIPIRNHH